MKKTFIVLLFGALMVNSLKAQEVNTDPIVMEIGGEKITQSEFLKNFRQANSVGDNATAAQKRNALNEYVDLFVNFRLKIKIYTFLKSPLAEIKIFLSIFIANAFNYIFKSFSVIWIFPFFYPFSNQITKNSSEILVSWV